MKEFIEKLIGRLEEEKKYCSYNPQIRDEAINKAISIVNQLAEEYNQEHDDTDYANIELYAFWQKHQWIPCSEQLPEEAGWYLGYVNHKVNDIESIEKVLWKKNRTGMFKWYRQGNDCEVVAWQPFPEPYTEGE